MFLYFPGLHAQFEIPGRITDVRQSDCAADIIQL